MGKMCVMHFLVYKWQHKVLEGKEKMSNPSRICSMEDIRRARDLAESWQGNLYYVEHFPR